MACRGRSASCDAIKKFIAPLSPPVYAFEASIRSTPFRILISVLLSARTQDPVTEKAAARLFAAADTPEKMARLSQARRSSRLIYPVGFYRTKARTYPGHLRRPGPRREIPLHPGGTAGAAGHRPQVGQPGPGPGVRRPAIAVDTHVFRISRRLGWAQGRAPGRGGKGTAGALSPPALDAGQPGPGRVRADGMPGRSGRNAQMCVLKRTCPSAELKYVRRSKFDVQR